MLSPEFSLKPAAKKGVYVNHGESTFPNTPMLPTAGRQVTTAAVSRPCRQPGRETALYAPAAAKH